MASPVLVTAASFAVRLAVLAALLVNAENGVQAAENDDSPSIAVQSANQLLAANHPEEAIALLEPWVQDHPDDHLAAHTLLSAKVSLKELEIRKLLAEQSLTKGMIEGDADYEAAKSRSDVEVQRRLSFVEYYLAEKQYGDSVSLCNSILKDYPNNEAVLCLKYRILELMVAREKEDLLRDQSYHNGGEGINHVLQNGTIPDEPKAIPRTVWIFDEDIEAAEREKVQDKLNQKVTLIYDGTNGTQSAPVQEILRPLFAYIGLNYVMLDDALGSDKLTIHLVDETVANALTTISRLVKVRFNYSGGTVFVTSSDNEIMETRIIHLQSGLTDVDTDLQMAQMSQDADSGSSSNGGGGGINPATGQPNPTPPPQQRNAQGGGANAGAQKPKSDLEKFLDKVPDIIEGWPADAKIYLDRKSNTLYVRSTPSTISELERLLNSLDYNNVQVLIEARFIEVSQTGERELGVDWNFGGTRGPLSIGGPDLVGPGGAPNPAASGATINGTAAGLGGVVPPTNGLFAQALFSRGASIAASITALEQKGEANTLSDPKILSLNNSLGVIEVKQNINFVDSYTPTTTNSTNTVSTGGVIVPSYTTVLIPHFDSEDTGITLKIRPSIARNSDIITLSIAPLVRELVKIDTITFEYPTGTGTNITDTQSKAEIEQRALVATLHIENGQTVALGGLASENDSKITAGVPFFSHIPLFGQLFRHDSNSTSRSNLVILVTASIVDPNGSKLSDEVLHLRDTAKVFLPPSDELSGGVLNPNHQPPSSVPTQSSPRH